MFIRSCLVIDTCLYHIIYVQIDCIVNSVAQLTVFVCCWFWELSSQKLCEQLQWFFVKVQYAAQINIKSVLKASAWPLYDYVWVFLCYADSTLCGTHNGTFLCTDKKCIFETWLCDKTKDCSDGADEQNCDGMFSFKDVYVIRISM